MLVLVALLISAAPFVITGIIVRMEFDKPLTAHIPAGSDEVIYWLEIRAFHDHGLDFGSFAQEEQTTLAGFAQFDSHGPVYPIWFGFLALSSGWTYSTPVFWNATLIGISIFAFVLMARLDRRQLVLFSFLILLFYPILLYIPSMMEESMHYCLALLLAGCILRMLRGWGTTGNYMQPNFLFFLLVLFAVLLRPTWSIAFIGLIPFISWRDRGILLIEMAAGWISMKLFWITTTSTYGSLWSGSAFEVMQKVWNHVIYSVPSLLGRNNPLHISAWPSEAETLLRYQTLLLVAVVAALAIIALKRNHGWRGAFARQDRFVFLFHLANLGGIISVLILFYDIFDDRDYRTLAPHVLLSMCVMIVDGRFLKLLWAIVISNCFFFKFMLILFDFTHSHNFLEDDQSIRRFQSEIAGVIRYTHGASAWENTLLFAPGAGNYRDCLGLPSGIGLSDCTLWEALPSPPKSRYIITDRYRQWGDSVKLRPLKMTSYGMLFENLTR
jgi:hypothetical protein